MSLILDALKKSEQERRRDKGPDLQTIHQPVVVRAPQRSYRMLWVALLLGINAAVIAYWWQQRGVATPATATPIAALPPVTNSNGAPPPATATAATTSAAVNAATTDNAKNNALASEQLSSREPAANAAQAVNTPGNATNTASIGAEYTRITPTNPVAEARPVGSARIEEVDELPEDVRNNLPAMTFSFHVYSSNPQQRTIIINNRRMREGDEVNAGLLLQEITEDGVILSYAQHRIHISVLSGW